MRINAHNSSLVMYVKCYRSTEKRGKLNCKEHVRTGLKKAPSRRWLSGGLWKLDRFLPVWEGEEAENNVGVYNNVWRCTKQWKVRCSCEIYLHGRIIHKLKSERLTNHEQCQIPRKYVGTRSIGKGSHLRLFM